MGDRTVEEAVGRIVEGLGTAWNAADGAAFGALFTEDCDYVTNRGDHIRGREANARGHQAIFDTIYRGSTLSVAVLDARALGEGVILAHTRNSLSVPTGPSAGDHGGIGTVVMVRGGTNWLIAAMQNTMIAAPPR